MMVGSIVRSHNLDLKNDSISLFDGLHKVNQWDLTLQVNKSQ